MRDITDIVARRLHCTGRQPAESQHKSQIEQLIESLTDELYNINRIISIQTPSYVGNVLSNNYTEVFNTEECYIFNQQISQEVSTIEERLEETLELIKQQLEINDSDDLQQEVVKSIAIEANRLGFEVLMGVCKCMLNETFRVLEKVEWLKEQRQKYYGENHGDCDAFICEDETPEQRGDDAVDGENSQEDEQEYWDSVEELADDNFQEFRLAEQTYKTVQEISEMQSVEAAKIAEQADQINRIFTLAEDSEHNESRANFYLARAKKNLRDSTKTTVILLVLATLGIIFLDRAR